MKKFKLRATEMTCFKRIRTEFGPLQPYIKLHMPCNPRFVGGRCNRNKLSARLRGIRQRETG